MRKIKTRRGFIFLLQRGEVFPPENMPPEERLLLALVGNPATRYSIAVNGQSKKLPPYPDTPGE